MTIDPTVGQIRVREIIYEYLPIYQQLIVEDNWGLRVKEDRINDYHRLIEEIRTKFSLDLTIASDTCTGQSLCHHEISSQYLAWLFYNNPREEISGGEHDIKTDRFVYDATYSYNPRTGKDMFAYQGGHKYDSTYSCLFGLAEGKELTTHDWVSVYYEQEGILQCGGGGSHRLLANVLWGSQTIKPSTFKLVKESVIDTQLHDALLITERLTRDCDLSFQVENYISCQEITDIKRFHNIVGKSEIERIKNFILHAYKERKKILTIYELIEVIDN
jgi:hypothetical protein